VLLQAVCCSDKLHCCPNGYTCDLSSGTCNKDQHSMSWNAMTVRSKKPSAREVDCPGSQQTCPDENTCCKLQSGTYACCPEPQVRLLLPPLTVICWYFRAQLFSQPLREILSQLLKSILLDPMSSMEIRRLLNENLKILFSNALILLLFLWLLAYLWGLSVATCLHYFLLLWIVTC